MASLDRSGYSQFGSFLPYYFRASICLLLFSPRALYFLESFYLRDFFLKIEPLAPRSEFFSSILVDKMDFRSKNFDPFRYCVFGSLCLDRSLQAFWLQIE